MLKHLMAAGAILLIAFALHGDAEAWTHGISCTQVTNYILGVGCSDVLLDGSDKLTAN